MAPGEVEHITPFAPSGAATAPAAAPATTPAAPAPQQQQPWNEPAKRIEELTPSHPEPQAEPTEPQPAEAEAPPSLIDLLQTPEAEETEPPEVEEEEAQPEAELHPAARRIAATKAAKLAEENEALKAQLQEMSERVITDEDVKVYQQLKSQAERARELELRVHYDNAYRQAVAQALARNEDPPDYDGDNWVRSTLRSNEPPVTLASVRETMREELHAIQQQTRKEFEQEQQRRTAVQATETFKADLQKLFSQDADLAGRPVLEQRIIARGLYDLWLKGNMQKNAADLVQAIRSPAKKAAQFATASRAEAARRRVPLGMRGSAPPPRAKANNPAQQVEDNGWGIGETIAAIQSGKLKF